MWSVVAPGCVFTCAWSFLEIQKPVSITMASPIIQICLRDFLFLFSFSWWSLIFVFDDDIVSYVSILLLNFRSLFSFSWRTDFLKPFLLYVGRIRFVLINSTELVLLNLILFYLVFESYLVYYVFPIVEASFPFLENDFYFQNVIIQSFCGCLIVSFFTVWH